MKWRRPVSVFHASVDGAGCPRATGAGGGFRRWSAWAIGLAAVLAAGPARAEGTFGTGVIVGDRDVISADLDSVEDVDSFAVGLCAGGSLSVTVKAGKDSDLLPQIQLFRPDGSEVSLTADSLGLGRTRVRLKNFKVGEGETGAWQVRVAGFIRTRGTYDVAFRVKDPKKLRLKGLELAAGETRELPLFGAPGTELGVKVKVKSGSPPASITLLDQDRTLLADVPVGETVPATVPDPGSDDPGYEEFREKVREAPTLVIEGDPGAGAVLDVKVRAKFQKGLRRREPLPPECTFTGLTPGMVRQGEDGVALTLVGENFLPGTRVLVSGEGVALTSPVFNDPEEGTVTASIAVGGPSRNHDFTMIPPQLLGEPATLPDCLTVLTPDAIYLESCSLAGSTGVRLDEDIVFRFSGPVLEDSIDADTIRIRTGTGGTITPPGTFVRGVFMVDPATGNRVVVDPDMMSPSLLTAVEDSGDPSVLPDAARIDLGNDSPSFSYGRRRPLFDRSQPQFVTFVPDIPNSADLDDTAYLAGASYAVALPGPPADPTIEDLNGDPILWEFTSFFRTVADAPGAALFLSPENSTIQGLAGPRVIHSFPYDGETQVTATTIIAIRFSQPLDPRTVTADAFRLAIAAEVGDIPLPFTVSLTQSRLGNVEVVLTPEFPIPGDNIILVTVTDAVTDLVGQEVPETTVSFSTGN